MSSSLVTYTRELIPLSHIYFGIKAMSKRSSELNESEFKTIIYTHNGTKLWWSWSEEEITNLGELIWNKTSTKKGAEEHFQKIKKFANKAIVAAEKLRKKKFSLLSNNELQKAYLNFYKNCEEAHALLNPDIDAVDVLPVKLLKNLIKKELPQLAEHEFINIYAKLTAPIHTSYVSYEEKSFLELLMKMKEKKIEIDSLKLSTLYPLFKRIINKYWWTCLGWENRILKTEKDYLKDLQQYEEKVKNVPQRIKELLSYKQEVKRIRTKLLEKYNLSSTVQHRLEVFDAYTALHDLRKEMQMRTMYSLQLLFQEIGRRIHVSMNDLQYYTDEEIFEFLFETKKWDEREFQQRKEAQFILSDENGIKMWMGEEAKEKIKEYYEQDTTESTEIKGICSSPGAATGIVRICYGAKEAMHKIKEGDILVTGMTLPDYVPAMRKAGAIVTDEGGITCHAAIVSRELKKPCITGTKHATEILKDGTVVEVDANNGVIKIIKGNKDVV